MPNRFGKICAMALLAGLVAPASVAKAPPAKADAAVRDWLRQRLGPPPEHSFGKPAAYTLAWADLNGDGRPEALVYLSGSNWCGTGGCKLYVLQTTDAGFRLRARTTITWPPIAILESRTHGWRDLGVLVSGGGISPGYQARLQFDGSKYLGNPSMAPPVKGKPRSQIIIPSDDHSRPLFDDSAAIAPD